MRNILQQLKQHYFIIYIIFLTIVSMSDFPIWNDGSNYIMNVINSKWFWRDLFSYRYIEFLPQVLSVIYLKIGQNFVVANYLYKWSLLVLPILLMRYSLKLNDQEKPEVILFNWIIFALMPLSLIYSISASNFSIVGAFWLYKFLLKEEKNKLDLVLFILGNLFILFGYETGILILISAIIFILFDKKNYFKKQILIIESVVLSLAVILYINLSREDIQYVSSLYIEWKLLIWTGVLMSYLPLKNYVEEKLELNWISKVIILTTLFISYDYGTRHFYALVSYSRFLIIPVCILAFTIIVFKKNSKFRINSFDIILILFYFYFAHKTWVEIKTEFKGSQRQGCFYADESLFKKYSPPKWTFPNISVLLQLNEEIKYIFLTRDELNGGENESCTFIHRNIFLIKTSDYRYGIKFNPVHFKMKEVFVNAKENIFEVDQPIDMQFGLNVEIHDRLLIRSNGNCVDIEIEAKDKFYGAYYSKKYRKRYELEMYDQNTVRIINIEDPVVYYYPSSQQVIKSIKSCSK